MESLHRKNFNPKGRFMVCSEHFNKDCFKRLFHMEGNAKRLEPRCIPTVWRKSELSAEVEVLCSVKVWYIDGTFKLCRKPFSQLLTINAFVRSDSCAKQIPLLFAIMSGRKKSDYKAVLKAVLQLLSTSPSVKRITLDYERAVWSVIRKLYFSFSPWGKASYRFTC